VTGIATMTRTQTTTKEARHDLSSGVRDCRLGGYLDALIHRRITGGNLWITQRSTATTRVITAIRSSLLIGSWTRARLSTCVKIAGMTLNTACVRATRPLNHDQRRSQASN